MKVRRPPKNVRQGKAGRNGSKSKVVPQIKTRKDLRKEKRQQKKLNRFNYHNRSRKERQQNAADNRSETDKKRDKYGKDNSEDESEDFEDEEIPSDFSDEEEETKPSTQKPPAKTKNSLTSQLDVEREKEMKELRRYEDGLKSNRIKQLEAANEDDDRIIQKYEKLLKINRRKNKEGVPKSFNDGLDYALELCTDDSIRKMYEAAKEAAELEENSTDEFVEDLKQAVGVDMAEESKSDAKSSRTIKKRKKMSPKDKNRVEKLKKIEEKYFGLDEMDDLGEYDSEMEIELDDNADDDYSENDELYESEEENVGGGKNAKRVKFASNERVEKKGKKRSNSESDSDDEYDDFDDEDDDEESAEESFEDEEPASSSRPVGKKEKSKSSKQSKKEEENDECPGRFVLLKANKDKQSKNGEESRGKDTKKASKHNPTSESEEEQDFDGDEDEFDEDEDEFDEENDGLDDLFEDGSDSDELPEGDKKTPSNDDGTWEDIYGRKRDKAGNVIKEESTSGTGGKYVPPHIRAKLEAELIAKGKAADPKQQEKLQRLKRQLKGQINRLAESNVHRISITLDGLYMQNSRYDMNSTLTAVILEATVVPTLTPERMVLEHMLLVAILHANVGSEVGSHFLETIVERFLELLKQIGTIANEAKQLDNCVQIMCHLYTFDIVKCKMVHELMQKLIGCFNEKAVECILLVLRSVGFMLRKDDPLALKDLIIAIQKKAANATDELKNDTRVKYMLETLLAVKNNNMNKIPQYDPTLVEHFRKLLKGMITSGKYVSTLNIGIEDIVNIPERGKWWLVGSAWLGNKENPSAVGTNGTAPVSEGQYSAQLLELARQQRMNTDDRRNVFCIVMSAEDYLDAFEKLIRLAIKDLRIVVSVIIHCSLAEKEYNPYYGVLSQKFCDFDRRYQLAIQYALWDRLKEIHALQQQQVRNLARFITHLIAEGGLALSCLKVIEFAEIDKVNLRLMRQLMLGLLLQEDENKCLQVFSRISASNKLKSFKDGIRLFMHHFLARGSISHGQLPDEQVQLLQQRIKQADELLSTDTKIEYDV
ncbi:nucleolar MIF4G domain-containing protein 1 homolog [Anopheles moucheti]|uniref:nucleolar MIF4G domain-containing protein 1 homolog n=1 Tax=Anopheles moucheti TaxID=186751 RepID=UPI0022F074A1|nr:nucleolar MIF4G domain-containing protein 1 homolog [Anopheles moucheti]